MCELKVKRLWLCELPWSSQVFHQRHKLVMIPPVIVHFWKHKLTVSHIAHRWSHFKLFYLRNCKDNCVLTVLTVTTSPTVLTHWLHGASWISAVKWLVRNEFTYFIIITVCFPFPICSQLFQNQLRYFNMQMKNANHFNQLKKRLTAWCLN